MIIDTDKGSLVKNKCTKSNTDYEIIISSFGMWDSNIHYVGKYQNINAFWSRTAAELNDFTCMFSGSINYHSANYSIENMIHNNQDSNITITSGSLIKWYNKTDSVINSISDLNYSNF